MELVEDERVPFQDGKSMRCEADHSMERAHRVRIIPSRERRSLGICDLIYPGASMLIDIAAEIGPLLRLKTRKSPSSSIGFVPAI